MKTGQVRPWWVTGLLLGSLLVASCSSDSEVNELIQRVDIAQQQILSIEIDNAVDVLEVGLPNPWSLGLRGITASGGSRSVTNFADWSSGDPLIVRVDATGGLTGVSNGTSTITAVYGPFSATVDVRASDAGLTAILISANDNVEQPLLPPSFLVDECGSLQLYAHGEFTTTDGVVEVPRSQIDGIVWSVADESIGTASFNSADDAGLLRTNSAGSITITATRPAAEGNDDEITGTATIEVASNLTAITVAPLIEQLQVGTAQDYSASGVYGPDRVETISHNADWQLTAETPAGFVSVDNTLPSKGRVTPNNAGTGELTVSCGSRSAVVALTSSIPPDVDRIFLRPTASPLIVNADESRRQISAIAELADNSTVDLTEQATWTVLSGNTAALDISDSAGSKGLLSISAIGAIRIEMTVLYRGTIETIVLDVESQEFDN